MHKKIVVMTLYKKNNFQNILIFDNFRGKSFDALTDSIKLQPLTEDNVASLSMDQWPRSVASQTVNRLISILT